jgi:hypothetical protein
MKQVMPEILTEAGPLAAWLKNMISYNWQRFCKI